MSRRLGALLFVVATTLASQSVAQTLASQSGAQNKGEDLPANVLVRRVIQNELREEAQDHSHWMYRLRKEDEKSTTVRELVETNEGIIARTILINDKPLTPEQRRKDDERMEQLVKDPNKRADKKKEQAEDAQRTREMFAAIPDAFLFEYDGEEQGRSGRLVRLRFRPNPAYDAPKRDLKVYEGMEGHVWLDPDAHRLAKIDAKLFKDVEFGWGILGRLDHGGNFVVEQSKLPNGRWETTFMNLDFTGKIMMLKSLRIKVRETAFGFRRAPDQLTWEDGIKLLRQQPDVLAQQR